MNQRLLLLSVHSFNAGTFTQISLRDPDLRWLAVCMVLLSVLLAVQKVASINAEFQWRQKLASCEKLSSADDKNVSVRKDLG